MLTRAVYDIPVDIVDEETVINLGEIPLVHPLRDTHREAGLPEPARNVIEVATPGRRSDTELVRVMEEVQKALVCTRFTHVVRLVNHKQVWSVALVDRGQGGIHRRTCDAAEITGLLITREHLGLDIFGEVAP